MFTLQKREGDVIKLHVMVTGFFFRDHQFLIRKRNSHLYRTLNQGIPTHGHRYFTAAV